MTRLRATSDLVGTGVGISSRVSGAWSLNPTEQAWTRAIFGAQRPGRPDGPSHRRRHRYGAESHEARRRIRLRRLDDSPDPAPSPPR